MGGRLKAKFSIALVVAGTALVGVTEPAAAAPVQAPVDAIDIADRDAVLAAYAAEFGAPEVAPGWTGGVDRCDPGTLSDAYRQTALRRINFYRAMAGVPGDVVEHEDFSHFAQSAALVMQANQSLDHDPPPTWDCWSQAAHAGASHSNLSIGRPRVTDNVDGQIADFGDSNAEVGHRAWLLLPNQRRMGIGHADTASAFWVVDQESVFEEWPEVRDDDGHVVWPPAGFVPEPLVFPRWSVFHQSADFTASAVTVTVDGQPVAAPVEHASGGTFVFAPAMPTADRPIDATSVVDVTVSGITGGEDDTLEWQTTIIPPPLSPTERFLVAAANDFLGHGPTRHQLDDLLMEVEFFERRGALTALAHSDAWLGALVDGFYRDILGRDPDGPGRQFWIDRFRTGTTPAQMAAEFYASPEHFQRSGNTTEAWVEALYREILGRASDPGGHAGWVRTATQSGRTAVAMPFYQSLESRYGRVTALYVKLLDRQPDPGGLDTWANVIGRSGNDVDLAIELAASDEYFARANA